ncbi:polysaccharide deacetylase family protein [Desulfovibrio sp.]|uniref:polysaccharide deacetylase family protein n=1 Tax=Desulfovibrio sp. TaxID=885 RepID=UPI0023D2AE80|nr:polysaccharide deacetylase family protein [Desulfovibrio sp.]MDE7242114.1 polysaccharide deacetylase family protein [Desulfovibrio sp.]
MTSTRAWGLLLALAILPLLPHAARGAVIDGNRIMDQRMSENLCAITFDDGPSRHTGHLLDMLRDYGIPATFFLLGGNAERNPAMVRRIVAEGHEVGNHSWSHPNLRTLAPEAQEQEISATDAVLRALGGNPAYLRPPYGNFDAHTLEIAHTLGVDVILWSMDSHDWKSLPQDYAKLRSTRGTQYESGDLRGIFLFHDTHKSTVDDLPRIIANLLAGGCRRFVTVSDYLAAALDPEPGLLMTRRPAASRPPLAIPSLAVQHRRARAGAAFAIPLARCSRPWQASATSTANAPREAHQPAATRLADGDAHAADDSRSAAEI